ncbi:hypothetical protein D3C81_1846000 [compost metagenome]
MGVDAITDFKARDVVTNRNYRAGSIAHWNQRLGHHVRFINAVDDSLVAKVERDSADLHQ